MILQRSSSGFFGVSSARTSLFGRSLFGLRRPVAAAPCDAFPALPHGDLRPCILCVAGTLPRSGSNLGGLHLCPAPLRPECCGFPRTPGIVQTAVVLSLAHRDTRTRWPRWLALMQGRETNGSWRSFRKARGRRGCRRRRRWRLWPSPDAEYLHERILKRFAASHNVTHTTISNTV